MLIPGRPLSLLWPNGRARTVSSRLSEQVSADLRLPEIIRAIVARGDAPAGRLASRARFAQQVLTELLLDAEVIGHRQAVLTDLLENPSLQESLEHLLPALEALGDLP